MSLKPWAHGHAVPLHGKTRTYVIWRYLRIIIDSEPIVWRIQASVPRHGHLELIIARRRR